MEAKSRRVMVLALLLVLGACASQEGPEVSRGPDEPLGGARTASGAPDFSLAPEELLPTAAPAPQINPEQSYSLPELIDIAQRRNPATAAAWERARAAALAAGEAEATYLPQLSANVLVGYERTSQFLPALRDLDVPPGHLTASGMQLAPNLAVEWLLFDFGARDAARDAAVATTAAANATFYGAHQRVMFEVSEAYFRHAAARAETAINRSRIEDARTLRAVVEGRLKEGLATSVEAAQARQILAQAEFDLTLAEGRERDAYARLMQTMGLPSSTAMKIEGIAKRQLPRQLPDELDAIIEAALPRRADVQAALAAVRASEAAVELAEAERLPRIVAAGQVGHITGRYRLRDSRFSRSARLRDSRPEATVGILFRMPLFDGGLRANREQQARAEAAAAQRDLEALESASALEIVQAYNLLRTSLAAYEASGALLEAAETAYGAALGLYKNGLTTLAEVSETKEALGDARFARAEAFSDAFIGAATLAFAAGGFTDRDVPASW